MSLNGFIGKKRGMTQVFSEEGQAVSVTVVELLPLTVTQLKTVQRDGYSAVQVGVIDAKEKHLSLPEQGHLKKNGLPLQRHLQEFRVDEKTLAALKVGDVLDPFAETSVLKEGLSLAVTGRSIGKGFQGATKRWNFSRGPMSHGSKSHRIPGSIGAGTTPGRVLKGKKMAGRMGNKRVTTKGLKAVRLISDQHVLLLRGAVPGVENGLLTIKACS